MNELQARKKLNEKLKIPSIRQLIQFTIKRNEWNSKTPYQKWAYFYGFGKTCIKPVGFPVYNDDLLIPRRSYLILITCATYFLLGIYTVFYYTKRSEFVKCLPCTCIYCIALSLVPLVVIMLSSGVKDLQFLIRYGGYFIYADNGKNTEYNRICSDHIDGTIRSFFVKMGIINIFLVAQSASVYAYMRQGIRTTLTELKFPFIAEKSDAEYTANLMLQGAIFSLGGLAYVAIEVAMGIVDDVASIAPKLIRYELQRFCSAYDDVTFTTDQKFIAFNTIIKNALVNDNYIACGSDLLFYRTFITPFVFTYAIAMSIFCQFTMNFVAGYGIAMISWVQLFYLCEIGENIEDNSFAEILYEFEWYILPIQLQKDVCFLISRKQNGNRITVGPFGNINRALFKDITRKIYSFVMFLLNMSIVQVK